MRKMILTGALVLFGAGTASQLVLALSVCILWFGLVANLQPFDEDVDDRLAQAEALQILFTLMIGLVLQLQAADEGPTSQNELGVLLILLNILVVTLALIQQPVVRIILTKCCAPCTRRRAMGKVRREWAPVILVEATDAECVLFRTLAAALSFSCSNVHSFSFCLPFFLSSVFPSLPPSFLPSLNPPPLSLPARSHTTQVLPRGEHRHY